MTQPIKPSEVGAAKAHVFPPEVFQAFNELIAAACVDGCSIVKQDDAVARIVELLGESLHENPQCRRAVAFDRHYLDVEDAYRAAGWQVEYDKPAYFESYPASFIFTKNS